MSMDQPPGPEPTPLPPSNLQPAPPPPAYQPYPPPAPYGYQPVYLARPPKSRSTAVLLAIFLGYFTWLYTYERDAWKFWVNLAVAFANVFLIVVTIGFWLIVAVPLGIGVWIWAIVDVAAKPQQFYDRYPTG